MKHLLLAAAAVALLPRVGLSQTIPPILPDPSKTPGVLATMDEDVACGRGDNGTYSQSNRKTSAVLKRSIRTRDHASGDGEVDHRIPLCLGGADVEKNLWWQPGTGHNTEWPFQVKDKLEAYACREVCAGHIDLTVAQTWFLAPDWREFYCREIGGLPCHETDSAWTVAPK